MKRKSTLLLLMLAMMLVISACSSNNGGTTNSGSTNSSGSNSTKTNTEDKSTTKENVTITAWAWNVNVGALNAAAELYKQEHPNVTLKVEDIGRLDVYDKLSTGLASGGIGLPDIVLVEDDRIGGYVEAFPKGFLDLSAKGFASNEAVFPNFKLELAKVNGTYYAFPFDAGPAGMFYRTDIFAQAGVDASTIVTWDDYIAAGKLIKEKTGSFLMPLDKFNDDPGLRMMLNQLGIYYFDGDGNIDFLNPNFALALTKQKEIDDAGLIKDVNGWDGVVSATVDGSVATIPFGAWYYGTIVDQAKDTEGKWGVFRMPSFDANGNRSANLGGSSWMIPSSTKNADEVYNFLNFFSTSDAVQQIAMTEYGLFPSLQSVYKTEAFTAEIPFFGGQKIWELFANEMATIKTPYYTNDYAIGLDEAVKAQAEIFNGKPVADALKEAADRLASRTDRQINNY